MTAQARYEAAHAHWFAQTYPNAFQDGHLTVPKMGTVRSANDIERIGCNFFKWAGHSMERTKVSGRIVNGKWIPSTGKRGSTDLKGFFKSPRHQFAIPLTIEVKFNKDRMSDDQLKYQASMTRLGVYHAIWRTVEDIFTTYDELKKL